MNANSTADRHSRSFYNNLPRMVSFTTFFRIIQFIATAPFILHRFFIRFMQPFAFGGIVLLWSIIIANSVHITLIALFSTIIAAYFVFKYMHGLSSKRKLTTMSSIMINEGNKSVEDNKSVAEINNDVECVGDFSEEEDDSSDERQSDSDREESGCISNNDFNKCYIESGSSCFDDFIIDDTEDDNVQSETELMFSNDEERIVFTVNDDVVFKSSLSSGSSCCNDSVMDDIYSNSSISANSILLSYGDTGYQCENNDYESSRYITSA